MERTHSHRPETPTVHGAPSPEGVVHTDSPSAQPGPMHIFSTIGTVAAAGVAEAAGRRCGRATVGSDESEGKESADAGPSSAAPATARARGASTAAAAALPARQYEEFPVNSMHWAAAQFHQGDGGPIRVTAHDPHDGVVEGWQRTDHPFFHGVQWHPEFAQLPYGHFREGGAHLPHANIMAALGEAATEDMAAEILQRRWRAIRKARAGAAGAAGSLGKK